MNQTIDDTDRSKRWERFIEERTSQAIGTDGQAEIILAACGFRIDGPRILPELAKVIIARRTLSRLEERDNRDLSSTRDRVIGRIYLEIVVHPIENDASVRGGCVELPGSPDGLTVGSRHLASDPIDPVGSSARPIVSHPSGDGRHWHTRREPKCQGACQKHPCRDSQRPSGDEKSGEQGHETAPAPNTVLGANC